MERRLLLAIVLIFVVLTAYQWLVPTPQPPASGAVCRPGGTALRPPDGGDPWRHRRRRCQRPRRSSRRLKRFRPTQRNGRSPWTTGSCAPCSRTAARRCRRGSCPQYQGPDGKPVDLVPHDVPANQPKPFSLKLEDAAKTARLNSALFDRGASNGPGRDPTDARRAQQRP